MVTIAAERYLLTCHPLKVSVIACAEINDEIEIVYEDIHAQIDMYIQIFRQKWLCHHQWQESSRENELRGKRRTKESVRDEREEREERVLLK